MKKPFLWKWEVPLRWTFQFLVPTISIVPFCFYFLKQHVHDGRKESLDGFVKTFEKLPTTDGYPGIYALDCEMVGPSPQRHEQNKALGGRLRVG